MLISVQLWHMRLSETGGTRFMIPRTAFYRGLGARCLQLQCYKGVILFCFPLSLIYAPPLLNEQVPMAFTAVQALWEGPALQAPTVSLATGERKARLAIVVFFFF